MSFRSRWIFAVFCFLLVFATQARSEKEDPLAELRKLADEGNAKAQVRLGICCQHGKGTEKDHGEATRWFAKAVEKDDPDGLLLLGIAYSSGEGVAKDKQKAVELLKKSSLLGHPMGMTVYGSTLADEGELATGVAYLQVGTLRLLDTDPSTGMKFLGTLGTYKEKMSKDQVDLVKKMADELEAGTPYIETILGYTFPLGPMIFTQAEAEAIVREIQPEVEKAAGRTFKTPPLVSVSSRFVTANSLSDDLFPQLRNLFPHQPEASTRQAALQQSLTMVQSLLGKYGFHDKTLHLLPRNMSLMMEKIGINASFTPNLVRVLVAHEMTHALQDQYLNLKDTLLGMTDQEAMSAFNAVIEGHAVFVQDSLGTALGLDREVMEFARFLSAGVDPKKEESEGDNLQTYNRRYFQEVYLGGRKFIDAICQLHGRNRLWDVLENPPLRTSAISFPDTYTFGKQTPRLDLSPILMGMESRFGGGPWQVQQSDLGVMKLKALYGGMPAEKLNALLPQFIAVQGLAFGHPSAASPNGLSLFFMRDGSAVRDLIDSLETMGRENLKRASSSGQAIIKDIRIGDLQVPGADIARRLSFSVGTNENNMTNYAMYRVGFRSIMVEFEDTHLNLPEPRVAEIALEIRDRFIAFRRKQAAMAASSGPSTPATPGTAPAAAGKGTPDIRDEADLKAGLRHFSRNDYPAARDSLRQLLQRQPTNAHARFMMAVMAAREKQFGEAWKHIEIARRASPGNEKIEAFIKRLQEVAPR
ncbi:MAG TPA: hypothetical protein PLU72_15760 [Candidatus Ozemobacteraceae bacterium]|nr:hypothetical protein [Candidatus Ozemobacteraceae bacterium]